jgi:hypothetical protein
MHELERQYVRKLAEYETAGTWQRKLKARYELKEIMRDIQSRGLTV